MTTKLPATIEREAREAVAAERAAILREGLDLYASNVFVMQRCGDEIRTQAVMECETHWDACLVLLAYGRLNKDVK